MVHVTIDHYTIGKRAEKTHDEPEAETSDLGLRRGSGEEQ